LRERSDEAIYFCFPCFSQARIASRSLSSGAHPRDPLARNDDALFGTNPCLRELKHRSIRVREGVLMGRYLLLWLIGVPLPILALIYAFGGLR
jgi:hypothetical protein